MTSEIRIDLGQSDLLVLLRGLLHPDCHTETEDLGKLGRDARQLLFCCLPSPDGSQIGMKAQSFVSGGEKSRTAVIRLKGTREFLMT